jgi:hypothetical protein
MSWETDVEKAGQFGRRHAWHGAAAVYTGVVPLLALLAFLQRPGEGGQEVIIDSRRLSVDLEVVTTLG